ncbi:MAG TPA: zinc-ribbon domain-containing protein [Blastocatellia bacterium]|nr:zinc-ribbon domain-containing protein [Blastocatellia bacterium]
MYCPNCAASNSDDTKFCRVCGANLSLVPQALTGQLPKEQSHGRRGRGRRDRPATIGGGIQQVSMGVAFLLISMAVGLFAPGGRVWWFWLLIPAFGLLGKGVSEIVNAKQSLNSPSAQPVIPPARRAVEMPPHNTGPIVPPPSVTEGTTRHLDPTTDPYKR